MGIEAEVKGQEFNEEKLQQLIPVNNHMAALSTMVETMFKPSRRKAIVMTQIEQTSLWLRQLILQEAHDSQTEPKAEA